MPVHNDGEDAMPPASLSQVDPKALTAGTYYFKYHAPVFAFSYLSADSIDTVIRDWVSLKNNLAGQGDIVMNIRGVSINTDTGDVFIKADVAPVPCGTININGTDVQSCVQEAGINPYAIYAIVAALGAALGIALTLMAVYGGQAVKQGIGQGIGFGIVLFFVAAIIAAIVWAKSKGV